MSVVMGVMVVLMIVGFLGFGHHHGMMGGQDKEDHKEQSVIRDYDRESPCSECPTETELEKEDKDGLQRGD